MTILAQAAYAKKESFLADKRFKLTKKFLKDFPKGYAVKSPDEMRQLGYDCGTGEKKRICFLHKNMVWKTMGIIFF